MKFALALVSLASFALGCAAPAQVYATATISPGAWQADSIRAPCSVDGDATACEIDTGSTAALVLSPADAAVDKVTCFTATTLSTAGGTAAGCYGLATLVVAGEYLPVAAQVPSGYSGPPLVGIPVLQRVWPGGVAIDRRHMTVTGIRRDRRFGAKAAKTGGTEHGDGLGTQL